MRVLKSNVAALIVTLFAVAFVVGLSLTAFGKPDVVNPGQPFNQIEAKLDKMGPGVMDALARLEGKLDRQERKLDGLEAKVDKHAQTLDRLTPVIIAISQDVAKLEAKLDRLLNALPPNINKLEAKLDKLGDGTVPPDISGLIDAVKAIEAKLDGAPDPGQGIDALEAKLDRLEAKLDLLGPTGQ